MKISNVSRKTVYLRDLRYVPPGQTDTRRVEDRYLKPGTHAYLPNTSEIMRSVTSGDIRLYVEQGVLTLEDRLTLAPEGQPGDRAVLDHDFHFPPSVYLLKQVDDTWVDATGTVDVFHDAAFTATTVVNVTPYAMTFMFRLL